ncbi:aflatoxin regulatory protein-domain-containing protein [Aspergillus venezuelensis]
MEPIAVQPQHEAPRPPAPGAAQGTRKLRESCISCSRSKVRCNREKPTCGRCVRRGLPCEYTVSRRTGRTRVIGVEQSATTAKVIGTTSVTGPTSSTLPNSGHSSPDDNAKVSQSANGNSNSIPCEQSQQSVASQGPVTTTGASPQFAQVQSSPNESELWTAIFSSNASSSTDLSSLLSVNTDFGQLFASLSPQQLEDAEAMVANTDVHGLAGLSVDHPSSVADPSSAVLQGLDAPDALIPPLPNHTTDPCCLAICLDTLMRLFPNARARCQRPGGLETDKLCTIETVIEDNKEILDTIQSVLECRCANDEYVATLISLIVFKVLGWYVAVARDRSSHSIPDEVADWTESSSGEHSRQSSSSSFEEQVVHLPAVVGSYCVDGHHQGRMAAQLVLSELYRVQRLVTHVVRRLESIRTRSVGGESTGSSSSATDSSPDGGAGQLAASTTASTPLSYTTLGHLSDDLRKRLRYVSAETISILRRA